MIILIAESKTMAPCDSIISSEYLHAHTSIYSSVADTIMHRISEMHPEEIITRTKLSTAMTRNLIQMAYEFPNKSLGGKAIEAYTGVVFKALDYSTLPAKAQSLCNAQVRIISSLYGWLRPDDIIKPYRLEYTSSIIENISMSKFWQPDVTSTLIKTLQTSGESDIINLLPADAAKCIDWKRITPHAKVWKIDFRTYADGSTLRTPHSTRLKTLRGHLLRELLLANMATPAQLSTLHTDNLLPDPSAGADQLLFLV